MRWGTLNAPKVAHESFGTRGPNGEAFGEKERSVTIIKMGNFGCKLYRLCDE